MTAAVVEALDGWLTTNQVAERFKVAPASVVRMIRKGRLRASKLGWVWLVHESDLPTTWPPPSRNDN